MTESTGVQSVARAFDLLELLADAGGVASLSELSDRSGLPMPTIHRLLRTLLGGGYVRQDAARRYALGPRLIRLGEQADRLLGAAAGPFLRELMEYTGESANLALLRGADVVYVAQVASRHSMRMFTEVGRRVPAHCTAVGKALLAARPAPAAEDLVHGMEMRPYTPHTITEPAALLAELARIRERGYAVDDQEQEIGVRCLAVAVPWAATPTAVSVSGPEARVRELDESALAATMRKTAERLGAALTSG